MGCTGIEAASPLSNVRGVGMCDLRPRFALFGPMVCGALSASKDSYPKRNVECRYYGWTDDGELCTGACRLNDYEGKNVKKVEVGK